MRSNKYPTWNFKPLQTAGLVLAWSILALLPFVATGCHKEAEAEDKKHLVEVSTTNPQRKNLIREVQQPGYLRPYEQTPIYTKIAGFAFEPNYDIGDYVKKGDTLVELYVPEVVQELRVKAARIKQAKADLKQAGEASKAAKEAMNAAEADVKAKDAAVDSAVAETKRWKGEAERADVLLKQGVYDRGTRDQDYNQWEASLAKLAEARANVISARANHQRAIANYNRTKADIEVADASVDVAEADHDQKRDWLAYRFITAPYDGVVTDRRVHSGHFLQPSNSGSTSKAAEPLFVMMRTDKMRCVVDVPELDAVLVQDGDKAIIHFDALPGVETIGTVKRNSGSLDDRTRCLRVEVWLDNPKGATINYTVSARDAKDKDAKGKSAKDKSVKDKGATAGPNTPTIKLPDRAQSDFDGTITSVDPIPPSGGSGYPKNANVQLLVAGGSGGIVDATTNESGVVVRYKLRNGGSNYKNKGAATGGETICTILRPFMYAHVTIMGKVDHAWSLPEEAVMSDILANANLPYCFVVEDGKAEKLFLQVGARCAEGVQILNRKRRAGNPEWEAVTGKEVVAITNNKGLQEGQEVQLQAAKAH